MGNKWIAEFKAIVTEVTNENDMREYVFSIGDDIDRLLVSHTNINISMLVTSFTKIVNESNLGKCAKCGTWLSEFEKPNWVDGTTDGAIIDGQWLCDVCLPHNHPKSVWYSTCSPQDTND